MQPPNKNFSRRSFLKFLAGFLAIFSLPGFGKIITSTNSKDEKVEVKSGYGADTYGL